MCKVMLLFSSICGVTSSEMPEKNEVSVTAGVVAAVVAVAAIPPVTAVTKKLLATDLNDRLLVVDRRDLRTRQNLPPRPDP